jgi:hypothetical protein
MRALGNKARIIVNSAGYLDEIRQMVPDAEVHQAPYFLKLIPKGLGLDIEMSKAVNFNLREEFEAKVEEVASDLKRTEPDLIVADIPAELFLAAHELGIPILAISNFGWTIILDEIFGKSSKEGKLYSNAYSKATKTLMLPFHEPMEYFSNRQEVGLLRRRLTKKMKPSKKVLSLFGAESGFDFKMDKADFYTIPSDKFEGQDYVASSRAVFSKPGYGVVSEAVANGVPLFLKERPNFCESRYFLKGLKGAKIVPDGVDVCDWILNEMNDIDWEAIDSMREKYCENSDQAIASIILSYLSGT